MNAHLQICLAQQQLTWILKIKKKFAAMSFAYAMT